jgi:hypothetical protein
MFGFIIVETDVNLHAAVWQNCTKIEKKPIVDETSK